MMEAPVEDATAAKTDGEGAVSVAKSAADTTASTSGAKAKGKGAVAPLGQSASANNKHKVPKTKCTFGDDAA